MSSTPYFNTYLYTTVPLYPSQMDNDIYKHLKENLLIKLQGKCYKSYGHISKIYKIEERSGGALIPEDPSASATYKVKFSCKLCRPLRGSLIVCEVALINESTIYLRNGPINVIIFEGMGQINQEKFTFDEKRNVLLAKIGGGKGVPVVEGTLIEIRVLGTRIESGTNKIVVFGTMENLASKEASDETIRQKENDDIGFVDYKTYMKQEKDVIGDNIDLVSENESESEDSEDSEDSEESDSTSDSD